MICKHCGKETANVICDHCGMNVVWFNKYGNILFDKDSNKLFYAYAIEDVIDYLKNSYPKKFYDLTVHNKGEK